MASARLHVVTGKGGVGKSTIAAAIAIAAARRGQRVLAIGLGEPGGLCRILGAASGDPGAIVDGAAGVRVAWFDGAAALAEYLTRRMHLGAIGRAVIAHPLYQAFVGAAPGVRELLVMGKVRDEVVLQARWDVVVVDAGASGHALEHLRMPSAAERAFGAGLVHREAERNAAFLRDRGRCAVHVVAIGEELPLREAAEVVRALRAIDLAPGAVIVNQCRAPAPPGVDRALARLAPGPVADALERARTWAEVQERGIARLERELDVTVARLPWLPHGPGATQAAALAAAIEEVVA